MSLDADGWDRGGDPLALFRAAGDRVSARKCRLLMAAAVRDARRHHLLPAVADAVSLAARYADGLVTADKLADAAAAIRKNWNSAELGHLLATDPDLWLTRARTGRLLRELDRIEPDPARRAMWLREVVGNPFRWVRWEDEWATRTAHALAADAYAAGRFDRLPVLADALEDAGCDNAELLAHLRGPGPHARGCWALDVVLGKV